MNLSVILSTYNKPRHLRLALESLARSEKTGIEGFEVLVADDGSGSETREAVELFSSQVDFEVEHVYQSDEGFRLAAIRNAAIRRARGDVLVFVDGDSVVHPQSLLLHATRCQPGIAHTGSRCFLDKKESEDLLDGRSHPAVAMEVALKREGWGRRSEFLNNVFYRLTRLKPRPKLIGGNCAVHRSDLERVNGFDERFVGWGLEDDDLARRLRKQGVRFRDGTLDCLVMHLFHLTHPSHRPSIHHTQNYSYFHQGGYLSRCRYGLKHRPLSDVSFGFCGDFPLALTPLKQKLGQAPAGEEPEVLLLPPGGNRRRPRRRAEIVVKLPEEKLRTGDDCIHAALRFLEDQV